MGDNSDIRVDHLWFSSDSLVIRAEKKVFRVTKSILAARSSIFRDMVAVPQPPGEETELIDGSPVVCLSDSAADVEVFLQAIFDSSYFMPPPAQVEIDAVLGILRLAHKYDVHYLYLRALEHLSVMYGPSSLDDYLARPIHWPTLPTSWETIDAITQFGALWLLPVAYYLAARLVSGRRPISSAEPSRGAASWRHGPMGCSAWRSSALISLFGFLGHEDDDPYDDNFGPLGDYDACQWNVLLNHKLMCPHCGKEAMSIHETAMEEFWARLPSIFGLPPWSDLNAMRVAVMGSAT
ncbi:hypothetical protein DFH09DRAFT_1368513 [Mycena vulgaris]|nr:hypothetical protein DFH09DRAFT_1368513 [Mycena vulgaris]